MTLPVLPFKIPEIPLPFDIPALMHPPIAHFIIALPAIVLLLEIINLIAKKRAIGVTSFFLLILTVVAAIVAFYTGSIDGKAAWDILSQDGQTAVKAHKLFGTYLMLASVVVVLFKLFSVIVQRGLMKALYFLVLIIFVAGILKQGKEGGELVYTYGANVKLVKTMDGKLFDCQDDLSDYVAEEKEAEEEAAAAKVEESKKVEEPAVTEKAVEAVKEKAPEAKETVEAKTAEVMESVEKKADEAKENITSTVKIATETVEEKTEEVKEAVAETVAKVEAATPEVEVVPTEEAPKPEIAIH